jgi:hypothetical protein
MSGTSLELVSPERLAATVIERFGKSISEISAYWIQVRGDREDYAANLRQAFQGLPIVVLIVRDISFTNPNAVAMDLIGILESNREAVQRTLFPDSSSLHCAIVLLGRTPLAVPQTSSPVRLPSWFRVRAGEIANVVVDDLTWTAEAPLNCEEARIVEICEALYSLEEAIIDRMEVVHHDDHNAGNALMSIMQQEDGEKYSTLIGEFRDYHRMKVSAPSAFRPSRREGSSLIGRVWGIVQSRAPEALHGSAKAVAAALGLSEEHGYGPESLAAVLNRPSTRDATEGRRFARSMLVTVASACQFVTAAAHAAEYPNYPIQLIVAFSYDLRRSLAKAEQVLR